MQHSSLVLFCDECGLANDLEATHCSACQHPLAHPSSATPVSTQIAPITITPPPVLEVTPGSLYTTASQDMTGDFQPGTILNEQYIIREEIGRGGFSVVYRAQDMNLNYHDVVVKRIQLSKLTPRQMIDATETFNREIAMLSQLRHIREGIPLLYDHLTDAGNWYLIMQYIKGQTLEDYLQQKPDSYLDEKETIDFGIALAQTLHELHESNPPVIFRDLKPANIIVTPEHGLYLIDFGIARNFTPGKTKDTTPLGSPGYAPPEQYGRSQTDKRSDIYSLGATLQTLITGRDPIELAAGEPSHNPTPPSPHLRKLLNQMLSPKADKRPSGMNRVLRKLQRQQKRAQRLPTPSYWVGLAMGISLCTVAAMYPFIAFISELNHYIIVAIPFCIELLLFLSLRVIRKKFGISTTNTGWFSWPFCLLGLLTVLILVPLALLLWATLQHLFWLL